MALTKDQIKSKLTELGIAFDVDSKLDVLKALLPKEITSKFAELEKEDTEDESANKKEFRRIIAKYKDEKPESYERNKEEYERILNKFNQFPDMNVNGVGWTSYNDHEALKVL